MKKTFFNRWLICGFIFIGMLIAVRIKYSGSIRFIFLVRNLFLAWIPYIISLQIRKPVYTGKINILFLFFWLLFFPNALYIATDLIHLHETGDVPIWFDAVLLFLSSFIGFALALASLWNVEVFLKRFMQRGSLTITILTLLFAGSFGVYLGRFERWNSWNIIDRPIELFTDVLNRFIHPVNYIETWITVSIFTGMNCLLWFFVKAFIFTGPVTSPVMQKKVPQ